MTASMAAVVVVVVLLVNSNSSSSSSSSGGGKEWRSNTETGKSRTAARLGCGGLLLAIQWNS